MKDFDKGDLPYIFMHELLHYKQKDMMFFRLLYILTTVYWFHPLFWNGKLILQYRTLMEDTLLSIDSEYENSIIPLSQVNYKQISVIKYYQEETKWCWAACAKMLGKYYTGTAKSQSNICNYVKGSVVNETATNSEVRMAIGYAIGGSYIATNVGVQSYSVFETKIYTNEKPFVLKITWNSGGAHVYVVAGVNGGTAQQVYLIDPEEGVSNKWYSYSALVNGTTLTSGTGSYTRTFLVS